MQSEEVSTPVITQAPRQRASMSFCSSPARAAPQAAARIRTGRNGFIGSPRRGRGRAGHALRQDADRLESVGELDAVLVAAAPRFLPAPLRGEGGRRRTAARTHGRL